MSDDYKKHLAAHQAAAAAMQASGQSSQQSAKAFQGLKHLFGGKQYVDPKQSWTEAEWLAHFQELEQYPEAAKAMKLYNSKLYKALK